MKLTGLRHGADEAKGNWQTRPIVFDASLIFKLLVLGEVSRHTLCPTQSDGYAITLPSNPPVGGNRTGHKEYVQDHVCNGRSAHVRKQRARQ